MKHAREDYNRIQDPTNQIPVDEPVFLLRAQDVLAPAIVMLWAKSLRELTAKLDDNQEFAALAHAAENHTKDMLSWQAKNGMKIPD